MVVLLVAAGCGPTAPPPRPPGSGVTKYIHQAGKILSGETLSHTFEFTNTTDEPLTIRSDDDIHKDCTCAEMEPDSRTLEPGATTRIAVSVNTLQKEGPFVEGGVITWTSPSGKKTATAFKLSFDASRSVVSDPLVLDFSPEEVARGTAKEVKFTVSVPVDWARAKVQASDPRLHVSDWHASGDTGVCQVKAVLPEDVETVNATVSLDVPLSRPTPTLASASFRVPVTAHQDLAFTITPRSVPLTVDKSSGRATARLVIRGSKLTEKEPIADITCDGYKVEWQMKKSAERQALVTVELTPAGGKEPARGEGDLVLHVSGMKPIHVPLVKPAG